MKQLSKYKNMFTQKIKNRTTGRGQIHPRPLITFLFIYFSPVMSDDTNLSKRRPCNVQLVPETDRSEGS